MKLGVLGTPISHSLSPVMMAAALEAADLVGTYQAHDVAIDDWEPALRQLHEDGYTGLNVTVPHKERALVSASERTSVAREIEAANTLVRTESGWAADNTDGPGFLTWLDELGATKLLEKEVVLLGAGGSARAILWALLKAGCKRVRVANRTASKADQLLRGRAPFVVAGRLSDAVPDGALVVNCTSLGLRGGDPLPLPEEALESAGLVLDLVYPNTPLVRTARRLGLAAEDGLGLLVAQGALSFSRWTGVPPDRGVMKAACLDELQRRATER